jgi:hypothetical protein
MYLAFASIISNAFTTRATSSLSSRCFCSAKLHPNQRHRQHGLNPRHIAQQRRNFAVPETAQIPIDQSIFFIATTNFLPIGVSLTIDRTLASVPSSQELMVWPETSSIRPSLRSLVSSFL